MALSAGDKLGPYEIVAAIGKGGMGSVYRARDTRLGRDVAVKVSEQRFSERFEREARVISSLNHPNICHLYDVGENYLVMELVVGQTLSERIKQGAIPLEESLTIAKQIAEALEAAHEKGITHRDLKPGNVMVKEDGTVKVLDFGLAKVSSAGTSGSTADDPELSPTLSMAATQAGVILGTAAYIAPEQARGKPVDKRADIWAFGVVLYEMVTGKRPFAGQDLSEVLASVIKEEPNLGAAPAELSRLLQKCLEKDPKKRLRDIGDAWELLEPAPAESSKTGDLKPVQPWAVIAIALVVAAIAWLGFRSGPVAEAPPTEAFSILPDPSIGGRLVQVGGLFATPRIAPDGTSLVFYQRVDQGNQAVWREMDDLNPVPLQVATGNPGFWDGDSEAFFSLANATLLRQRLPDGALETVVRDLGGSAVLGGSINDSGTLLITVITNSAGAENSLYQLREGQDRVEPVAMSADLGTARWPEFLPEGNDFLFVCGPGTQPQICLATLQDGKAEDTTPLMANQTHGYYTPAGGGFLLYVKDDNLYAQRLNRAERRLEGDPQLIQKGVASSPAFGLAHFSVSQNGRIVWRAGRAGLSQVTILDREGKDVGRAGVPAVVGSLRLAPDERRLVLTGNGMQLLEVGQAGSIPLGEVGQDYIWSAGGTKFFANSVSLGESAPEYRLMEIPVEGGQAKELAEFPTYRRLQDASPDGRAILFTRRALDTGLFTMDLQALDADPVSLVNTGEVIQNPSFGPEGRWVVYQERSATSPGIYVQPYPGNERQRTQIASVGNYPRWRADGREIVYVDESGEEPYLWSVPVTIEGATLRAGQPKPLFPIRMPASTFGDLNFLEISADGSRIFIPQAVEQPDVEAIYIRSGWAPE